MTDHAPSPSGAVGGWVPPGFSIVTLGRAVRAFDRPLRDGPVVSEGLLRRYAEPHRRYHTAEHVAEVQAEIERLWRLDNDPGEDVTLGDAVELAAMFHDAVYDVEAAPGVSESASADLAVQMLSLGHEPEEWGRKLLDDVHRLILLTAGHEVEPEDRPGALLVDADLWILSSPPERYDRYAVDVRAEYAHVDDEGWRTGRGAVLRHFLDQADALYAFGPDDDRIARRARARVNLERELASLPG